jgi:hypothetical protein
MLIYSNGKAFLLFVAGIAVWVSGSKLTDLWQRRRLDAKASGAVAAIVEFLFPGSRYDPDNGIPLEAHRISHISPAQALSSSHLIEKEFNDLLVKCAYVTEDSEYNSGPGQVSNEYTSNLFMMMPFDKGVQPDILIRSHSIWDSKKQIAEFQKDIEDISAYAKQFGKYFYVSASETEAISEVLDEDTKRRLFSCLALVRQPLNFAFARSYLFISLPVSEQPFYPDSDKSLSDYAAFAHIYYYLGSCREIIETITVKSAEIVAEPLL